MDPVSSLLDPASSTPPVTPDAFSQLNSEQFVKIMFTELTKQDPLKPNDSNALLQQMSSLRSIQSNIDLSQKLNSLVAQNQLATAGGLIGHVVSGVDDTNTRVAGVVSAVSVTSDGPVLRLATGERVPFGQIDTVLDSLPSGN